MISPSYKNYSQTSIRSEKTQADITRELNRYGIYKVQHTQTENVFSIAFQAEIEKLNKPITVRIDIPYIQGEDSEDRFGFKVQRVKYRVLYFYIKSLLNAWDSGLKTFMDIFMPHIVLPGGRTVSQDLLPKYKIAIDSGKMKEVNLLPEGTS